MVTETEAMRRFPCQCCGFLSLRDPTTGSYEICPICFWEDDPVQNDDPQYRGGANRVPLDQARKNYIRFGACEQEFVDKVRPPVIDEVPALTVATGLDDSKQSAILRGVKAILLGVVRAVLGGRICVLEGCSAVAAVALSLKDAQIEDQLRLLVGVASEADEFPIRASRHLWAPDALTIYDQRAAEYSRRVESRVREACTRVEDYLKADLAE